MKLRELISEDWSKKYKRSIDCSNPKGFSQRAHCQGRKKNESAGDRGDIPTGPGEQLIPFPAGTTMIDVSDAYDWYKLGMVISDLDDADPKIFGQGAPHTAIVFGSEEEEHKLLPLLKRLGLSVHDIDNPQDVKKAIPAKALIQRMEENLAEESDKCPPATQDIKLNLENRQKAIDEYGYGPLNPDLPNTKFWLKKVDEWNLDSADEAKQSLCGNCAAFDVRQETLDCIAKGIDSGNSQDAEGVIEAGELGYCKFLKFKCASRRTCDAWVTGGPLTDSGKSDQQGVTELFAPGKDWKWGFKGRHMASAVFKIGRIPYQFYAHRPDENYPRWDVEFKNAERDEDHTSKFGLTGTGNSAEVMSTIVDIMRAFLKEYQGKIKELTFTADESSRQALYARMAKRLLPTWNLSQDGKEFKLSAPSSEHGLSESTAQTFAGKDPMSFKSPKGGTPTMIIVTAQGSRYLITSDGMVLRNKSFHANTGGEDQGLKNWSDAIEFYDPSELPGGATFPMSVAKAVEKRLPVTLSKTSDGKRALLIHDGSQWRVAKISDVYKHIATTDDPIVGTYSTTPKLNWNVLDYNVNSNKTLKSVHPGSPVTHGIKLGQPQGMSEGLRPKDIHRLADRKGVKWDNEPSFLRLTKRLTGKAHLDDLDQAGLQKVKQHLEKQDMSENFADGRNPQDKGDSARHGIRKGMSIAQLKKIRSSDTASARKKQLAHWQINMRQGKKK